MRQSSRGSGLIGWNTTVYNATAPIQNTNCPADAVVDEPGLDIILDPTGDLERCLTAALTEAELKKLANFAPVSDAHDRQAIKVLCAMWDMDHMLHGMSQVGLCL